MKCIKAANVLFELGPQHLAGLRHVIAELRQLEDAVLGALGFDPPE